MSLQLADQFGLLHLKLVLWVVTPWEWNNNNIFGIFKDNVTQGWFFTLHKPNGWKRLRDNHHLEFKRHHFFFIFNLLKCCCYFRGVCVCAHNEDDGGNFYAVFPDRVQWIKFRCKCDTIRRIQLRVFTLNYIGINKMELVSYGFYGAYSFCFLVLMTKTSTFTFQRSFPLIMSNRFNFGHSISIISNSRFICVKFTFSPSLPCWLNQCLHFRQPQVAKPTQMTQKFIFHFESKSPLEHCCVNCVALWNRSHCIIDNNQAREKKKTLLLFHSVIKCQPLIKQPIRNIKRALIT